MSTNKPYQSKQDAAVQSTPFSSPEGVLDQIGLAIEGLRYGEVRVIIQDSVIVQIERVEKKRLR